MSKWIFLFCTITSFSACAKDGAKDAEKKEVMGKTKKPVVIKELETKSDAPCDSKEDLLKKLEEKKKAEAEKGKGLSLQGGDTGCSVK